MPDTISVAAHTAQFIELRTRKRVTIDNMLIFLVKLDIVL